MLDFYCCFFNMVSLWPSKCQWNEVFGSTLKSRRLCLGRSSRDATVATVVVLILSGLTVVADQRVVECKNSDDLETNLVLSPIVFQGRLVSRSGVYNSLYFASFRVLRPLKGHLPPQLRRQIKLMFREEKSGSNVSHCPPVSFSVQSGMKYAVFAKQTSAAHFVAVAKPVQWSRNVSRQAKRTLCPSCARSPSPMLTKTTRLTGWSGSETPVTMRAGQRLKLRCSVGAGNLRSTVDFFVNGRGMATHRHVKIRHKRRRSTLRLARLTISDQGNYTCRARNVLGNATSNAISITVVDAGSSATPKSKVSSSSVRSSLSKATACPIADFCLNGGQCLFYDFLGELVCRCENGFTGHRCEFKAAQIALPTDSEMRGCGPYGHDVGLSAVCAAWIRPSAETHMTASEFRRWRRTQTRAMLMRKRSKKKRASQYVEAH